MSEKTKFGTKIFHDTQSATKSLAHTLGIRYRESITVST